MKYNFIEEYSIDKDLCKRLIEFFKSVPMGTNTPYYRKLQGQVGAQKLAQDAQRAAGTALASNYQYQ